MPTEDISTSLTEDDSASPAEIFSTTLKDREAAQYIGMSESWLRQSRSSGNPNAPPFLKIGRAVRYLPTDLDKWLSSCRQNSGRNNRSPCGVTR